MPSLFKGADTMAPSGKFCIAMPIAKVRAAAGVTTSLPLSIAANTTPTAIPSGILCKVTASTNINDLFNLEGKPSGLSLFRCKCGITVSNNNKNKIPTIKPTAAGSHLIPLAISIDGINNDQTEAAIITPEANPNNTFSTFLSISFFKIKIILQPSVVPTNGNSKPTTN